MTSLSATVANWNSQADYKYGDTVLHNGQVWLAVVGNPVTGRPPYWNGTSPGSTDWYNLDTNVANIPRPVPTAITNFRQTAALWDPENSYGSVVVQWEGGDPNVGYTATVASGSQGFFPEENSNTATIVGVGGTPGFSTTASITALSITGPAGNVNSPTITITTLGPPPAATITLVAASVDATTGLGSVAILINENNLTEFNRATSYRGVAVGSPNATFTYNRANGTGTFNGIVGVEGTPAFSYEVFIIGDNEVGDGPPSNILTNNFNPNPPLPDDATNYALVTFLVGGADLTTGWVINTNNNPIIGGYDCNTGAFSVGGVAQTNPIPFLKDLQEKGVRVILSLGGATFNVAAGLTNGAQLAQNIGHAFFGVSAGNWVPYGSTLTPANQFYFDGLDLDWETAGPADLTQLTTFVTTIRTICPDIILTMSPQPPYSARSAVLQLAEDELPTTTPVLSFPTAFNANGAYSAFPLTTSGVADYVPSSATPALMDQNFLGYFDYVFVQYYNNPDWEPGAVYFNANVAQWAAMTSRALPRSRPPVSPPVVASCRMVLGFASADAERLYTPAANGPIETALRLAQTNLNSPSVSYLVAGTGLWNSPTAQTVFTELYTGIANLPSNVLFMWLNQNSIDPNWSELPIFDDIVPGVPLPPLALTLSVTNGSSVPFPPSPNNIPAIAINLTNPPAGLITLQVKMAIISSLAGDGSDNLSDVPILTNVGNTYYIAQGIQNTWFYQLEVRGVFPEGITEPATAKIQFVPGSLAYYTVNGLYNAPGRSPGEVGGSILLNPTNSGGTTPNNGTTTLISVWVSDSAPVFQSSIPVNFRLLNTVTLTGSWTLSGGIWSRPIYFNSPFPLTTRVYYMYSIGQPGVMGSVGPTAGNIVLSALPAQ